MPSLRNLPSRLTRAIGCTARAAGKDCSACGASLGRSLGGRAMARKSTLVRARIVAVEAERHERILRLRLERRDRDGRASFGVLVCELIPNKVRFILHRQTDGIRFWATGARPRTSRPWVRRTSRPSRRADCCPVRTHPARGATDWRARMRPWKRQRGAGWPEQTLRWCAS